MSLDNRMREEVVWHNRTTKQNPRGEEIPRYEPFVTTPAHVRPLAGRALWHAQQAGSEATTEVRIRAAEMDGLKTHSRGVWRNRVLEVDSVVNADSRDRELIVLCKELESVTDVND